MSVDLAQGSEGKLSMAIPERPGKPGRLYITSKQTHSDKEDGGMLPGHGSLSKPTHKQTTPADHTIDSLYELIITNDKGYGLFATDGISRGTRVTTESLLLTTPPLSPHHGLPTIDIEDLSKKLDGMSAEQHEIYFGLYHDPDVAAKAKAHIRLALDHSKHAPVRSIFPNAHKIKAIVKFYAIYQANFVELSIDEKSGTGVFPLASRINHSCVPNLQIHYIPATKTLVAHTVRHINEGEELTISYSSGIATTRNAILQHRGFECKCTICTGSQATASQARRESMIMLELTLAAFEEPDEYARLPVTPQTLQEALEAGELLIESIKTEGVADHGLQAA
jgi:hypothetical protein